MQAGFAGYNRREAMMKVLLANPRGFCAGVDRAIAVVESVLATFPAPVYVRHEVVHNQFVVNDLKRKGAVFVEDVADVPDGAVVVFSAHGVSQGVRKAAAERALTVFDATCPLVTKVHIEVARNGRKGMDTILIGHRGHPEVDGTMGQYNDGYEGKIHLVESVEDAHAIEVADAENVAYVTQTTLSVDDTMSIVEVLKRRFPKIQSPRKDDICYATQNRQNAVKRLVEACDLVIIIGSRSSSNSNRLYEIPLKRGVEAHLIDGADEIDPQWLQGKECVGLSAGASAPEVLVAAVIEELKKHGAAEVRELDGVRESVAFPLPRELRMMAAAPAKDAAPGQS